MGAGNEFKKRVPSFFARGIIATAPGGAVTVNLRQMNDGPLRVLCAKLLKQFPAFVEAGLSDGANRFQLRR